MPVSTIGRPILVVDDDPTILATVSETLDLEGYPVVTATNGAEALVQIGAHGVLAKPFDLDELIAAVQRLGPSAPGASRG